MKYYEYIKSDAWKEKKKKFYSSKMYKLLKGEGKWNCYCCSKNDVPLDLHHRTYKRLFNEHIGIDLVPVCRDCHSEIHKLFNTKKVTLWKATKKIKNKKNKK